MRQRQGDDGEQVAHAQAPDLANHASTRDSARLKRSRIRVPTTPALRPKSIVAHSGQALPNDEGIIHDVTSKKKKMDDREPNFEPNQNGEDGPINLRIGVSRLGSSSAVKQTKKPAAAG